MPRPSVSAAAIVNPVAPHHAQGIRGILFQHFPVLAGGGGEHSDNRFPPEAEDADAAVLFRIGALRVEHFFHFPAKIGAEIEREKFQQRLKHSLGEWLGLRGHVFSTSLRLPDRRRR
ncbi:MAG: hypothetical protein HY046_00690 [Acidobacteria bacterium]|nr:hypothetical protein [Acidobacteriota bacterium]